MRRCRVSYHNQAEYDAAEPDEPEPDQGTCRACGGIAPGEYGIDESGDDSPDTVTFTAYDTCPECEEPLCPECARAAQAEERCSVCASRVGVVEMVGEKEETKL
jgi:hypothetical protein